MSNHVKAITMKSSNMFLGKIFDSLIMFVFNVIAARLLGAKDYGIYVYISTIILFGSITLKMGLDQGLTALVPRYEDDQIKKSIISFSLIFISITSVTLILISVVFSEFISKTILNNVSLSNYLVQMAPLLLFYGIIQLSEGIFRTFGNIKDYVLAKNIIAPLTIIIVFLFGAFVLEIKTIGLLIVANYCGWLLASIYIVIALLRSHSLILPKTKFYHIYKKLFLVSIPLIFVGLLDFLIGRTDTFVIGYLMNEESVGIYNVVDKVAYLSGYFFIAFSSIIAPYITKLYHDKKLKDLELLYRRITRLILFINIGIMYMVILNTREILAIFGDDYILGYKILIVTVVAYTVNALAGPVVYMNSMTGAGKGELWVGTVMLVLNLILDWIMIQRMGLIGVSIATLIVFFGGNLYRLIIMKRRLNILPFDKQYVYILLIGFVVYVCVNIIPLYRYITNNFLLIIVTSLMFLALYCITIFGVVLHTEERKNMKAAILQVLGRKL